MKHIITFTTLALLLVGCSEKKETVKEVVIPKVTVKKIKQGAVTSNNRPNHL